MNLKDIIAAFVRHRREVVTRRTIFELRKARDRAHILEALAVALATSADHRTDPSCADACKRKLRWLLIRGSWATLPPCSNVRAMMLRVRNGWSQSSACVTVCTT